jgi:hypothetical protein
MDVHLVHLHHAQQPGDKIPAKNMLPPSLHGPREHEDASPWPTGMSFCGGHSSPFRYGILSRSPIMLAAGNSL